MIAEFISYLRNELRRAEKTLESYELDLHLFEEYLKEQDVDLTWYDVDADLIRSWLEEMMDSGKSASSVCRRLSALRTFYKYALRQGYIDKDPTQRVVAPKKGKNLPYFLREGEMNKLIDDVEWGADYAEQMLKTIILTFYFTGMRLSELTGLNDGSIDFSARLIKVLGKRDKERLIPFGEELYKSLLCYKTKRDSEVTISDTDAFFVMKSDGTRVTPNYVRRGVKKMISSVSTVEKNSPHVLRHTFATVMLNNDADIESLRKLLGHASLSATEIYTHTTFEQLKRDYDKAHPRS